MRRLSTSASIILALISSAGCGTGLFPTTRTAVEQACLTASDGMWVCGLDNENCDLAAETINAVMQARDMLGYPRNGVEQLFCNDPLGGQRDCTCIRAAIDYVFGDAPEDPTFDICRFNIDKDPSEMPNYEAGLAAAQAEAVDGHCAVEDQTIETGVCTNKPIRYVYYHSYFGFDRGYYDAETGAFLAWESATDVYLGCNGSHYWPVRIDCEDRTTTEIICAPPMGNSP